MNYMCFEILLGYLRILKNYALICAKTFARKFYRQNPLRVEVSAFVERVFQNCFLVNFDSLSYLFIFDHVVLSLWAIHSVRHKDINAVISTKFLMAKFSF